MDINPCNNFPLLQIPINVLYPKTGKGCLYNYTVVPFPNQRRLPFLPHIGFIHTKQSQETNHVSYLRIGTPVRHPLINSPPFFPGIPSFSAGFLGRKMELELDIEGIILSFGEANFLRIQNRQPQKHQSICMICWKSWQLLRVCHAFEHQVLCVFYVLFAQKRSVLLLMEEILHQLTCMKPCK